MATFTAIFNMNDVAAQMLYASRTYNTTGYGLSGLAFRLTRDKRWKTESHHYVVQNLAQIRALQLAASLPSHEIQAKRRVQQQDDCPPVYLSDSMRTGQVTVRQESTYIHLESNSIAETLPPLGDRAWQAQRPLSRQRSFFIQSNQSAVIAFVGNKVGVPNAYFTIPAFYHNQTT